MHALLSQLVLNFPTCYAFGGIAYYSEKKELTLSYNFVPGFLCQAAALVIVGYTGDWKIVIVFLTISVGMNGFVYSGFFVNHLDIAPQYASVLMGISNTIATLPGILSPLLTGVIVKHQVSAQMCY